MRWGKDEEVDGFLRLSGSLGNKVQSSRREFGKVGGLESQEVSGDLPERGSQGDEETVFSEVELGIAGRGALRSPLADLGGL